MFFPTKILSAREGRASCFSAALTAVRVLSGPNQFSIILAQLLKMMSVSVIWFPLCADAAGVD